FDLGDSTNTSWVYEEFGEDDGLRTGAWVSQVVDGSVEFYGGNRGASADPWTELGIHDLDVGSSCKGRFYLFNPVGLTNANFTNGENWIESTVGPNEKYEIQSSENGSVWTTEYSIAEPVSDETWTAWSRNEALTSGIRYVGLYLTTGHPGEGYLEAADCTVTLDSSNTPTHEIGNEQGNYTLDCVIENTATGDSIALSLVMGLDETLEVDTDGKTVTLLADGSGQLQALTLVGGARRDWLRLVDGENELSFEDTGTEELEIVLVWDRRLFE
ncbi:MAG: hypothetical protein DRI81_19355, partial [Chloroflexi bacterium]